MRAPDPCADARRPRSPQDYGKSCQTQACKLCGQPVEVPGSSLWWGKGIWIGLNNDTSDHPELISGMVPQRSD